jgi:hypothetical protein
MPPQCKDALHMHGRKTVFGVIYVVLNISVNVMSSQYKDMRALNV